MAIIHKNDPFYEGKFKIIISQMILKCDESKPKIAGTVKKTARIIMNIGTCNHMISSAICNKYKHSQVNFTKTNKIIV